MSYFICKYVDIYCITIRTLKNHKHNTVILKLPYLKNQYCSLISSHIEWDIFKPLLSLLNTHNLSCYILYRKQGFLYTYNDFSFLHCVELNVAPHWSRLRDITILGFDHGTLQHIRLPGSEIRQLVKKNSFVTQPSQFMRPWIISSISIAHENLPSPLSEVRKLQIKAWERLSQELKKFNREGILEEKKTEPL